MREDEEPGDRGKGGLCYLEAHSGSGSSLFGLYGIGRPAGGPDRLTTLVLDLWFRVSTLKISPLSRTTRDPLQEYPAAGLDLIVDDEGDVTLLIHKGGQGRRGVPEDWGRARPDVRSLLLLTSHRSLRTPEMLKERRRLLACFYRTLQYLLGTHF
ncbi:hypothetical protein Acr_12g0001220 [Actinidia rufa]|uniref:Uncharacterized protein n=1 Tax=Actinidia rufa TaxID=165716 RepID=A0A7J0FFX8_9ERIC|nr:hypothetical protein Acr_12g0001220 [Actinidia rufa]